MDKKYNLSFFIHVGRGTNLSLPLSLLFFSLTPSEWNSVTPEPVFSGADTQSRRSELNRCLDVFFSVSPDAT